MINFFRKIRQKILSENRFSKYLIYAVGEIVLVMIGILLALQVNNWNEKKKNEDLEVAVLQELKANLLADIHDFETNIRWHGKFVRSCQTILHALENRLTYHDSLSVHFANIPANPIFMPTTSAYENLKVNGFNLISNDSLRGELQGLYEARYAFTRKVTGTAFDYDYDTFGQMYREQMSTYSMVREAQPVDYASLYDNQQFKNLLSHKMTRDKHGIIPNYQERIGEIQAIITLIDHELNEK